MKEKTREDVIEIDLRELFGILMRWLWLITVCGAIAGAVGFVMSALIMDPQYESTTKVYILNRQESGSVTLGDTQLATQLTKDYNELIGSRYVLERVIGECGLTDSYEELTTRVTVENKVDTRIISITVQDEDPVLAQLITNTVRDVAAEHITAVMDIEAVNIVESANLPTRPSGPSVLRWTAIGALLGTFLCAAVVVVRFMLDDTLKSAADIENYLGLGTLALIPDTRLAPKKVSQKKAKHSVIGRFKNRNTAHGNSGRRVVAAEPVRHSDDENSETNAEGQTGEIRIEEITDI